MMTTMLCLYDLLDRDVIPPASISGADVAATRTVSRHTLFPKEEDPADLRQRLYVQGSALLSEEQCKGWGGRASEHALTIMWPTLSVPHLLIWFTVSPRGLHISCAFGSCARELLATVAHVRHRMARRATEVLGHDGDVLPLKRGSNSLT